MRKHHFKSNCKYHIVVCPKYRHKIMTGRLKSFIEDKIRNICMINNYRLLDFVVEPDHVHLCVSIKPTISISSVVHKIKFITGYHIFKELIHIKNRYF